MKFDFCIGNPPYQGDGDNLQQVYPLFYLGGREIADCVEMIFPSAWQEPKNGSGLSRLNKKEIKEDKQIVLIDNQVNVFHNIGGAKNTNIIIWKKDYDNGLAGKQLVYENGLNPVHKRLLCSQDEIKKPDEINVLAEIVRNYDGFVGLDSITSALKPYGLRTDVIKNYFKYGLPKIYRERKNFDDIIIYHRNNGIIEKYFVQKDYPFPKVSNRLNKFKVFIGKTWGNMSDATGLGGAYSDIIIGEPGEACTEKFLESGCFDDYLTAEKHAKYLMTNFCRALLFKNKSIQDNSKVKWRFVPVQDYHESFWNGTIQDINNALMEKYNVPQNVRLFVNEKIQGRRESNIVKYYNSRNPVHGLYDFDKYPLEKIKWHAESSLVQSISKFSFGLGSKISSENYKVKFDVDSYFENNRGYSLPVNIFDCSILIFADDYCFGRMEIANVGINFTDVFKGCIGLNKNSSILSTTVFYLFIGVFNYILAMYKKKFRNNVDLALVIMDTIQQLPLVVEDVNRNSLNIFTYIDSIRCIFDANVVYNHGVKQVISNYCIPCKFFVLR